MQVFISYRRADSQVMAGRIAQFLDAVPAVDRVFLDVDDIAPGEDFERRIQERLRHASHVFVLVGRAWPGPAGADGRPRVFSADDVVRAEVRLALASTAAGKRVVPILLDDARMPSAADLPDDLKSLSRLNAFVLRSARFDDDMDALLDVLIGGKEGRGSRWRLAPLTARAIVLRALGGLAGGGVLLLLAALANRVLSDDCYDVVCRLRRSLGLGSDADALGVLWILALGVLAVAMLVPFMARIARPLRRRL